MIDAFIHALSPTLLLISLGGVVLGVIWGALPGLSTTMAMMLLIGLSTGLSLDVALAFMLGVYTGSTFGGAVSAVLMNIPGTPDSIPTMMEGYPLAKQGKGGEALGLAITASFLGNWFGIILLVVCMPVILTIALNFKSWEMFLLAVIGISVCGTMSAGTVPLKGWITGWLGLLVAFIGYDAIHGVARFTYDIPTLYDGVSYVAILIGMYGLAEVLKSLPEREGSVIPEKVGRTTPSIGILLRHMPAAFRSGIIGTIVGAIPGAGANIAAFLSYDIGRRRAKPEEQAKWGKGSYEGIVCAEVANNANMGGSMLPTLTLGIPGSAPAAAMLAALQLKNVVLGPAIEVDHPGLVAFIYALLIVANLMTWVAALVLIKPCVKLFTLRRELLLALIIPICVIGAYSVRTNMFDVWIMLAGGFLGYFFYIFKFPAAPVVLGVILAPIADENLRRALLLFENKGLPFFAQQYVGHVLLLAIAAVFVEGLLRERRTRRRVAAAQPPEAVTPAKPHA
ncbi:MAG: transporter [Rhizobiales bacterium]|nr:transporter [Hyphomicrobiales bacterium]